jgi:hypothetical protein
MAQRRAQHLTWAGWSRTIEWALAGLVVAVLVVVFTRHMRVVQGQGEYAAVKTTLGALRTALVIDYLHRHADPAFDASVAKEPRSPFDLLQYRPVNYAGIVTARQALAVAPGSWVYDPACPCVGYRPVDDDWFDSPSGEPLAWYMLGGAPGPLQLTARERYLWQDQVLD